MKKILTTILAGTMVAGTAFAADAKISLNYRARLDAFSLLNKDNMDKTSTNTRDWMNWNGYGGASSDNLDIQLKSENIGARLTLATNVDGSSTPFAKTKEYSGWMKFNVGPGTLKLDTGNWADGFADGDYRVKTDHDNQSSEGFDFERFKLGSIFKGSKGLVFVDDLTSGNGEKNLGGFATYGFDVTDGVKLNLTVGGVKADDFDEVTDVDGTTTTVTSWKSAFASRVQVGVADMLNAEFIYKLNHTKRDSGKTPSTTYNTFALYVMPKIFDALTLNVGGAVELGTNYNKAGKSEDYTDWAVDIRLRYQVMDPLSITFYTNVSGTSFDDGRQINGGIVGSAGRSGYAFADNTNNPVAIKGLAKNPTFKVAMWNHLTGHYRINDLLKVTLNLGLITPLSKVDGDNTSYSPEWRVTPGIQIIPEGKASLWAGVAISGMSAGDASAFGVDVPVIFRIKW